jgi:YD repeat-containing protein
MRNDLDGTCTLREYDKQDRLIKETLANGLTIAYGYDNLNRVTSIHLPDRSFIRYLYSGPDLSEVQRLSSNCKILYTHTYNQYDKAGNLLKATPIGQVCSNTYTYDLLSRPTSILAPSFKEKMQAYDSVGNLTVRTFQDAINSSLHTYRYDELNQLIFVSGYRPQVFAYDSLRNPVMRNHQPCHVNHLNQLIDNGTCTYQYNANGHRISKNNDPNIIYQYDVLDRLISLTTPTHKIAYTYDASNRRLSKTTFTRNNNTWLAEQTLRYLYHGKIEI